MTTLMTKSATQAMFIQCDITCDQVKIYPYIFNAVDFNTTTMEWMVVARVRINKLNVDAYALAYKKIFE